MSLTTRRGRDGELVRSWYGRYTDETGKRVCLTLCEMKGEPSASGNPEDEGNPAFERSREKAKNELKRLQGEARADGQTAHLTQRLVEIKTGRKFKVTTIKELPALAETLKTKRGRSKAWRKWQVGLIKRFTEWATEDGLRSCLDVTPEIAERYFETLDDGTKTVETLKHIKGAFSIVFSKALPEGVKNPFQTIVIESNFDGRGETEHRTPLTEEQENLLLETARRNDPFIYRLIVTALTTGLRRGDICRLQWRDVFQREGLLKVRTSKTGAVVELPILPTLREVLETALAEKEAKEVYVFPEAQRLIDSAPDRITYRVKRAFAQAFIETAKNALEEAQERPERVDLADVLPEVLKAIEGLTMTDKKRNNMIAVLNLYASGKSYREIQQNMKISRPSISELLHRAREKSGFNFIPYSKGKMSIRNVISNMTRKERDGGSRKASKYDFASLRTTFCTRWLKRGKSIEKLAKFTGHKTAKLIQETYNQTTGADCREELEEISPSGLLGSGANAIETDVSKLADAIKNLSKTKRAELQNLVNRKAVK